MTSRQTAILNYHQDLASFATNANTPVFVILDLEDSVGFEIASHFQSICAEKRDAIKDTAACPSFTLALPINERTRSSLTDGQMPSPFHPFHQIWLRSSSFLRNGAFQSSCHENEIGGLPCSQNLEWVEARFRCP